MNVILFAIDTLRADHLGCYGYFRDTSPTIDALAAQGVLFEQAHASAVATGPGFTSIITGRAAISHGFYLTPFNLANCINFDDNILTLPELIWEHTGYTTAAFDNLINFRSHMKQFVRGFEYYVNVTRSPRWIHHHVVGGEVNARLIPWLRAHADEDFFVFVHYWDPHTPYNQPEDFRRLYQFSGDVEADLQTRTAPAGYSYVPGWGRVEDLVRPGGPTPAQWPRTDEYPIDLYDGEIRYTDHLIEQVVNCLDDVGVLERTALLITSDHGEQLGQHGWYGHGGLHEANTFVPMILWRPGLVPEGLRMEGYVQHDAVAPTVLELAGAPAEEDMTGFSLLAYARGELEPPAQIFLETERQRAILRGQYKLIHDLRGLEKLYDIVNDPMETEDLLPSQPELGAELQEALDAWVAENLADGREDPQLVCQALWEAAGGPEVNKYTLDPPI
ncbi:MAG: sulfatase [Armatimonadetes bacterium]|nr:sulfatase [Armatimonadota bacterium]